MFAYCNNNPVMCKDPSGKTFLYDPDEPDWASSYSSTQLSKIYEMGIDNFAALPSDEQDALLTKWLDIPNNNNDIFDEIHSVIHNSDEKKVIEAQYLAWYKGRLVIKIPNSSEAFSFGIIFLGNDRKDVKTLRHEFGHTVQLENVGLWNYAIYFAIPSVKSYWINSNMSDSQYYSQLWEYTADYFGGVNRQNYLPNAHRDAFNYYNNYKK